MMKKSKQGSNFQWNEGSSKYKIERDVQSSETSKVSIAWPNIKKTKVVLLLIIQTIEWITTKTQRN